MKTIISALIFMMVMIVSMASCTQATASQGSTTEGAVASCVKISGPVSVETSVAASVQEGSFFSENWGKLVLGLLTFYDTIARLTPSKKDNTILAFLNKLLNVVIPNLKKGGGRL